MKIKVENGYINLHISDSQESYRFAYDIMNEFDIVAKDGILNIQFQDAQRLLEIINDNQHIEFDDDSLNILSNLVHQEMSLRNHVIQLKNLDYESLNENNDFNEFKSILTKNLDIDFDHEEFGDVTRKQSVKVYAMNHLDNLMNFSEPGAGKTLMSLMTIATKLKENEKVIIVSPINSMNVWKSEIKKFFKLPNDEKLVHFYNESMHSKFSDMPKKYINDFKYAKFILINYESVQKIADNELAMYVLSIMGYHIIFDEAHRIKNGLSIRNIRSKVLSEGAKSRITLTGTPFSTSIDEIKQMISVTWPNGNPFISDARLDEYASEIKLGEIDNSIEAIEDISQSTLDKIKEFSKEIEPLYFSLSKTNDFNIDAADDLYDDPILTEPLGVQLKIDKYIMKKIDLLNQLLAHSTFLKSEKERIEGIRRSLYTAGEQNLVNPYLLKDYVAFSNFFENEDEVEFRDLPKIKATLDKVKELTSSGKKVIVWFTFVKNILNFKDLLTSEGIIAEEIHGDTDHETRQKIIDSFSKPESKTQVLISNPATIAESISLHKSVSDSIFVERTFSYFRWAQAKDRIHRVGSKQKVTHNYVKSNLLKMDKTIFNNLKKKDLLANEIFKSGPFSSFELALKLKLLENNDLEETGILQEQDAIYNSSKFDDFSDLEDLSEI